MDPADLERLVDRDLKALPLPRAPRTLLPRVMAAVVRPAPTGWFTWPRAWQAASIAAVAAIASAVTWLLMEPPQRVTQTAQAASETVAVLQVLWDLIVQPAAAYIAVLGVALALACAAGYAALELALGGASQR